MGALKKLFEIAKEQNEERKNRYIEHYLSDEKINKTREELGKIYDDTLTSFKCDKHGEVEYYSIQFPHVAGAYRMNRASIYGFPKQDRLCEGYVHTEINGSEIYWHNTPISTTEALLFIENDKLKEEKIELKRKIKNLQSMLHQSELRRKKKE